MKAFLNGFTDSAKEFKNLKSIVTAALLIAIHTILSLFLSIYVTDSLKISISFIANVVVGAFFGPVMGFVCGGLGDIIQYIVKPTGPYFYGWTVSAALAGLVYGTVFYKHFPKNFRIDDYEIAGQKTKNSLYSVIVRITGFVLPVVGTVVWFVAPFAKVINKKTGEILVKGTAFDALKNIDICKNSAIVAGIMLAVYVFIFVISIWDRHTIPLIVTVIGCFAAGLAIYTDKKTMTIYSGYWIMTAIMILYVILQIVFLAKRHSVDIAYMLRCTIAMAIVCIVINSLLGTYWVSVMYGKGFAFYFTTRFIKNIVQMPINIILIYYVLGMVGMIKKKM